MAELEDLIRLNMTKGIGVITYKRLLERFGSPKTVLEASKRELREVAGIGEELAGRITQSSNDVDVDTEFSLAEEIGVKIVPYTSDDYPHNLKSIYDPPLILYIKGELKETDAIALAIVGSRRSTYYGQSQAERMSASLAGMGFCIVSGLARGIDAAAHRGALKAKGRTIAVLGNGMSTIYPPEHKELAERIAENGALISELPMRTPPDGRNFPPRNRLISGLSLGVVVVEASPGSGSIITAQWALEQGKEVFAVPGNIDNPYSRGTHKLIKEGAKLVECVDDIIEELGPLAETLRTPEGQSIEDPRSLALNEQEKKIFSVLSSNPMGIDEVTAVTGLSPSSVASTLMILEIKKLIKQLAGKRFVKV
ncbi:MAG TPA: DNA-processing protein DprA [Candidatus Brocadiales bacterium]|nr:DNA-processing protein DprA [Candidatus Brocadiales bacterium]